MNLKKISDSLIKDNVIFAADVDEAIQHFTAQGFTNVEVEETGEFSPETGEKEFRLISDSCGKKRHGKKITDEAKDFCIVEYQDDDSSPKSESFEGRHALDAAFEFASNVLMRDGERKVTITYKIL